MTRVFAACAVVCASLAVSAAGEPEVLAEADVVVVGGTSAGVSAALAAKKAGASVYLVAPRPYLGEDLAGKLRIRSDGTIWKSKSTLLRDLRLSFGAP